MKKIIFVSLLCSLLFISGCGKTNDQVDLTNSGTSVVVNNDSQYKNMTQEEVESSLNSLGSCSVDADCEAFYGACPLGCHLAVNKDNLSVAQDMITNWIAAQDDKCVYDCVGIKGAACQNNKCVALAEDINDLGSTSNLIQYDDTLNVAGIGPDISLEATVGADVLVLHKTFEDHSDHIFIDKTLWEQYDNGNDLKLPGNKVHFVGILEGLEAAAGNHYYQAKSIVELTKTGNPSSDEVKNLINSYGFCEKDDDCKSFYGVCPLGCNMAVNTKYFDIAQEIISNFDENKEDKCTYKCMEITSTKCNNYKCEAN